MTESPITESPLQKAIRIAGGQSALGRIIDRRQSTVWEWLKLRKPLPAEHVLKVEAATGISRHELRPDLYPQEEIPAGRTVAGGAPVASCNRRSNLLLGEPAR
jgi:DNA-binding transcriptional regulator YdaS (Cro superfamily)